MISQGIDPKNQIWLAPLIPMKYPIDNEKDIKFKNSFYTFDVETKDGLKGKELYCWSLAYMPKGRKRLNETNLDRVFRHVISGFEDIEPLFEFLSQYSKGNKLYQIIYVHNLSFDIRFIIKYCIENSIGFTPIISGSNFIACMIDELKVKFIDSFQFLRTTQEKAEIEWNIPEKYRKKETNAKEIFEKDFDKWTEKEKDRVYFHNKFDVVALWGILYEFRRTIYEISSVDFCSVISLAMLSLKSLRVCFYESKSKGILNPFIYRKGKSIKGKRSQYGYDKIKERFVRESYYGGRNEVFNLNLLYYMLYVDRVSMYPAEMFDKEFPSGYPTWYGKTKLEIEYLNRIIDGKEDKLGFILCKISKGKATTNYPVLPKRIDKRVMFTDMSFTGVYCSVELEYARKKGYKIIPIKGLIFPLKKRYFKKFVGKFIKIKEVSKGGRREGAKRLMNSCYGKFGQDPKRKEFKMQYFHKEEDFHNYLVKNPNENAIAKYDENLGIYMIMEPYDSVSLKQFMIVSIASFTTAYSRLALIKMIHKFEDKRILTDYTDTDSLVIPKSNLKDFGKDFGTKLGKWGVEKEFKKVKFLAPKAYISINEKNEIKLKLKGVRKSKLDEIMEQAKTLEEVETLIREPIELAEIYMKFKESMRHGMILGTKELTKHYSFENLKRKFDENTGLSIAWNDENAPQKYLDELENENFDKFINV